MDPNFPLQLWCRILPQFQDTLNMLHTSRLHPHMSSFTHTNGPFYYNTTPIAPPGMKTLVYEIPQQRKTWAQHGVDAWYIGYCPDHYRCHKTYVPATRGEQISHTLSFSLHDFAVQAKNHQYDIARSIRDLTTALQHHYLHTPLQPVGDKQFAAIQALEKIFFPNINRKQPKRLSIQQWNPQKLLLCYNKYNNPPQLTYILHYRNFLEATQTDINTLHAIVWRKIHIQWLAPANIPMQPNNWQKTSAPHIFQKTYGLSSY